MMEVSQILGNPEVSISINSNKKEHPRDACLRRVQETTLFFITIGLLLSAFLFCGFILLNDRFGMIDQKWAMTTCGSIISGFLGFLTGKKLIAP